MFKTTPLENEDDLKIMFGPIVCTNETTLVPRVEDANSSSDGHEEDSFGAGENSTPNPSSTVKGKRKVLHDSPKPKKKKDMRDEYMEWIVDAVQLCNRCVREFLIPARTWFVFGLPSKTWCDKYESDQMPSFSDNEV
jgi:hypothetical protein